MPAFFLKAISSRVLLLLMALWVACTLGCSIGSQLDKVSDSTDRLEKSTTDMKTEIKGFTKASKQDNAAANTSLKEVSGTVKTLATTMTDIQKNDQRVITQQGNKQETIVGDLKKAIVEASAVSTTASANLVTEIKKASEQQSGTANDIKKILTEVISSETIKNMQFQRTQAVQDLSAASLAAENYEAAKRYVCQFEFRLWNPQMSKEIKKGATDQALFHLLNEMSKRLSGSQEINVFLEATEPQAKFNALVMNLKVQNCSEYGITFDAKNLSANFYSLLLDILQKEKSGTLSDAEKGALEYKPIALLALQTYHNLAVLKALKIAAALVGKLKDGESLKWGQKLALFFGLSWDFDFTSATAEQKTKATLSMKAATQTELDLRTIVSVEPQFDGNVRKLVSGAKPLHPEATFDSAFKALCELYVSGLQ